MPSGGGVRRRQDKFKTFRAVVDRYSRSFARRSTEMTATAPAIKSPPTASGDDVTVVKTPLCYVVDEESSIRHFVSLIMQGAGIDAEEFADGESFRKAVGARAPDLVLFNVPLETADAIQSIEMLGRIGYAGAVLLMSNRGSAVLENVKTVGEQHKLRMLPVLKKPFETSALQKVIDGLRIGIPKPQQARISLDDALKNNWIEFWIQPKIDLRKKQLAGAEAFARARHPEYGVLSPPAFIPGANADWILKLSELAITRVIEAGARFSEIGINLRMSVNISVDALVKLPVADIIRSVRPDLDGWPGIIIDLTEEQIVSDMKIASDIAKQLAEFNVRLAIDDFGRGYSSLARLKELPFVEVKLDRSFVSDCATDKVNAPICKTVIDLAHNFGSAAVAIGIEKASDLVALLSMGCDYGQGFLLGQPMPEERFMALLRQRVRRPAPAAVPEKKTA
jgi:EAL domain-containing protein (putative c-di-GMP-specific phosphodiesterase class I)